MPSRFPVVLAPLTLGALVLTGCSIPVVLSHNPPEVRAESDAEPPAPDCPSYVWGILDGVGAAGLGVWTGFGVDRAVNARTAVDHRGAIAQSLTTGVLTLGYGFFSSVGISLAASCRADRSEIDDAPRNPDLKPPDEGP